MNWELDRATKPDPETPRGRSALAKRTLQLEAAVIALQLRVTRLERWRLALVLLMVSVLCGWLERIGK